MLFKLKKKSVLRILKPLFISLGIMKIKDVAHKNNLMKKRVLIKVKTRN